MSFFKKPLWLKFKCIIIYYKWGRLWLSYCSSIVLASILESNLILETLKCTLKCSLNVPLNVATCPQQWRLMEYIKCIHFLHTRQLLWFSLIHKSHTGDLNSHLKDSVSKAATWFPSPCLSLVRSFSLSLCRCCLSLTVTLSSKTGESDCRPAAVGHLQ